MLLTDSVDDPRFYPRYNSPTTFLMSLSATVVVKLHQLFQRQTAGLLLPHMPGEPGKNAR
jgi:hypothetical protein